MIYIFLFYFLYSAYRALYILNWVYRFFTENKIRWIRKFFSAVYLINLCFCLGRSLLTSMFVKMLKIAWVSGLIQTALYADFFYYYFKRYISMSLFFIYIPGLLVLIGSNQFISWIEEKKLD